MLMTRERRPAIRTLRGWALNVLQEAGAIHEGEAHGWARDRADPHARGRAGALARQHPPDGVFADRAVAEINDVLASIDVVIRLGATASPPGSDHPDPFQILTAIGGESRGAGQRQALSHKPCWAQRST